MKCRFSLSYGDLEEMASIRGAKIDHATLQGSVASIIEELLEAKKLRFWTLCGH